MIIDLKHNKIVADTISAGFAESVHESLLPLLLDKYGDTNIMGVQMYEDYLSDNFMKDGSWYYPFTVVTSDGCSTEWVRWDVNNTDFDEGIPYSYIGEQCLRFKLADSVPEEFENKLVGRARYCEGGLVKIRVDAFGTNVTRLSGKYSQTFIDEMARQLTEAIEKAMSVEGLADSDIELSLTFAPGTYMEHISENITYRRLTIRDKGTSPRDFWVKWTRLEAAVSCSAASSAGKDNILFELGEDVSQKVREKEYRYLMNAGKDEYHNAMSRKNVIEWRDVIRRAVRRGDLIKVENTAELVLETRELEEKLADVLGRAGVSVVKEEPTESFAPVSESIEFERAMRKMREVALGALSEKDEYENEDDFTAEESSETIAESFTDAEGNTEEGTNDVGEVLFADLFDDASYSGEEISHSVELFELDGEAEPDLGSDYKSVSDADDVELEEITRLAMEALKAAAANYNEREASGCEGDEFVCEDEAREEDDEAALSELLSLEPDETDEYESEEGDFVFVDGESLCDTEEFSEEETEYEQLTADMDAGVLDERERDIRAELEEKIRLEYESRARQMAEEEIARLRQEQEAVRTESERMLSEARREQERIRLEYEKLLEDTKRINAEREAREAVRRAEEERLRAQIEAQLRQEARERERLAEAARMAIEEQRRLEEENARRERERQEEERRIEEERLRREAEARIVAEREAEAERIRLEIEAARAAAKAAMPTVGDGRYSYTSKTVKLIFRRSVDPNITARIHEIIKATIEYYGKDKIFMKIRASVPDAQSVNLEFLQIPIEEMELLGNIIKILGNSGLGIAKAIVE